MARLINILSLIALVCMFLMYGVTCFKSKGFILHPDMMSSGSAEIALADLTILKSTKWVNLQECHVCYVLYV